MSWEIIGAHNSWHQTKRRFIHLKKRKKNLLHCLQSESQCVFLCDRMRGVIDVIWQYEDNTEPEPEQQQQNTPSAEMRQTQSKWKERKKDEAHHVLSFKYRFFSCRSQQTAIWSFDSVVIRRKIPTVWIYFHEVALAYEFDYIYLILFIVFLVLRRFCCYFYDVFVFFRFRTIQSANKKIGQCVVLSHTLWQMVCLDSHW